MLMNLKVKLAGIATVMALLGVQSCAVNTAPKTLQADVDQTSVDVINGDRPAMWRIADENSEIFLFGTFHILPPDTQWQSAVMDAAMVSAPTTYLEADSKSPQAQLAMQQAVRQYGLNPPGVTLSSALGAERAAEFATIAEQYGVPLVNLEPLRPWLATLSLVLIAYGEAGFDIQSGAEAIIMATAKEQNDEMRYLENGVDQIKVLASLDDIQDYTSVDGDLAQLANMKEDIIPLFEAWRSGDVKALEHTLVTMIRDVSPTAFSILLEQRNRNWVDQIETLMAGEGKYFIAVGAAHLVGKDSVVDMLREGGYAVSRVQ